MDMRGYQQYKEQSISTMTQGELLLMLYDELVKRLLRAELALEQTNYDLFEASIDRCVDIIRHLDDTLDRQYPISNDLHRMYDYFCYELSRVKFGLNMEELRRVKPMLIDLRDTFKTAAKTASEDASS
jgi:flagellar protein FliS